MTSIVVPMPGNREIAGLLAAEIGAETGELLVRHFPDGESYLRYETPVEGKSVVLVATLDRPDAKILPLIFAAGTAMDLGASRVGLVAPYLAYMRQIKGLSPARAYPPYISPRLSHHGSTGWSR
jgi:ribose-phosphate pyrophosphokinase